jgi:hypothetical protein
MARTRAVIEKHIAITQDRLNTYVSGKGLKPTDKKKLRLDPQWRRLKALITKFQRQIVFIEKRNRKGTASTGA